MDLTPNAVLALQALVVGIVALLSITVILTGSAMLLRGINAARQRRWRRHEAEWTETLDAVAAGRIPPGDMARLARRGGEGEFVEFVTARARTAPADARARLCEAALPHVDAVERMMEDPDPDRRARAVHTLGMIGGDRRAGLLLEALADPAPVVATAAARELIRTGDPALAEIVVERLDRFDHWSPRYVAALLSSAGPEIAPMLAEVFADPTRPPFARACCADALRKLRYEKGADAAARVAEAASDRELAGSALRYLRVVATPAHRELTRRLVNSPDEVIRGHAARILGVIGDGADARRLCRLVGDESPWVAIHAARGLLEGGRRDLLDEIAASDHPRSSLARELTLEASP